MYIALVGYKGLVGCALYDALRDRGHDVIGICRQDYEIHKEIGWRFGLVINAAMPSKRFWAANHPLEDFDATVRLTADLIYNWMYEKFVQISTVSARCQLNHPYGLNKAAAEKLVLGSSEKNLVFRLGGLFGEGLDKGAVFDLLQGNKIYVAGSSRYNFISTKVAARLICERLERSGIIDIGARDQISLEEMVHRLSLEANFGERYEEQSTENPESGYPSALEVLDYMASLMKGVEQ